MSLTDTVFSKTASLAADTSETFSKRFLNKSPSYLRTIRAQGRELNHKNLAAVLNNVSEAADFHSLSAQSIPQLRTYASKWREWEDELANAFSAHLIEDLSLNEGAKRLVKKHFIEMLD